MADSRITDYTEISAPVLTDLLEIVEATGPTNRKVTLARLLGQFFASTAEGRLTTETGVGVSITDRTAQSTLYYTPYVGNRIALYDGTRWRLYTFTERSLALSGLTADKNYDAFLYDNAGTLTLELSAAWTNDTTRADALATQDGVLVKSGATTHRYLGTIRTTGTTTTEDSLVKRFVWNMANRVPRPMLRQETVSGTWTYTTDAFRQANANAANQLDYVVGVADVLIEAEVQVNASNGTTTAVAAGIGVDSTTTTSADVFGTSASSIIEQEHAQYRGYPGLGRHTLVWLERSQATGTTTWYAGGGSLDRTGIRGVVPG